MALSFALSDAGYDDGELNTTAKISLEKNDDGFEITQSALSLDAEVEGITEDEFEKMHRKQKKIALYLNFLMPTSHWNTD